MVSRFEELDDSPTVKITSSGFSATRKLIVPWEERTQFAQEARFNQNFWGMGAAGYPEASYATLREMELLPWGSRITSGPLGDAWQNTNAYADCLAILRYEFDLNQARDEDAQQRASQDGLPSGTWCTYQQNIGGELLPLTGRELTWPDNTPVGPDAHPALRIGITEHQLSFHAVRRPPWKTISDVVGKVNLNAWRMKAIGIQVAAETLLFESCRSVIEFGRDPSRPFTYRLDYTFKEKRIKVLTGSNSSATYGWNHVYRENTRAWEKPTNGSGGGPMYQRTTLFDRLFREE